MSIQLILSALRSETQAEAQEEPSLDSQAYGARTTWERAGPTAVLSETLPRPIDEGAYLYAYTGGNSGERRARLAPPETPWFEGT